LKGLQNFIHSIGILYDALGNAIPKHSTGSIKMEDNVIGMVISANINYELTGASGGWLLPLKDGTFSFIDEAKLAVKGSRYKFEGRGQDISRWAQLHDVYGFTGDEIVDTVAVEDLNTMAVIPLSFNQSDKQIDYNITYKVPDDLVTTGANLTLNAFSMQISFIYGKPSQFYNVFWKQIEDVNGTEDVDIYEDNGVLTSISFDLWDGTNNYLSGYTIKKNKQFIINDNEQYNLYMRSFKDSHGTLNATDYLGIYHFKFDDYIPVDSTTLSTISTSNKISVNVTYFYVDTVPTDTTVTTVTTNLTPIVDKPVEQHAGPQITKPGPSNPTGANPLF